MAHISFPFKKTNKTLYQKPTSILTDDALYWKKLGLPVLVKEFGAIDYLDFSPVEPHYFAATCSVRVQVYDPITKVVTKNISKFVEAAYGGNFRADGRLLVAGSEEKVIKLFDVHSKNLLRVFTGHTGPVHRTFFTKDSVKLVGFSDDKTVSQWDIATEKRIATFSDHTDYVRAGAPSPLTPDIILSGGYDHMVKLYDCRSNTTTLSVNHGSPVESVLFLPSGGIFVSAGGTEVKVWDIFNGGKLLSTISQHHKTVTSLRLASNNSRLLSGSLDRHVKIYDVATFKVVHTIDFPNAVMSMAISENDDVLAVGMVDGVVSIRKREQPVNRSDEKKSLMRFAPDARTETADLVVYKTKAQKEFDYDKFLRKMQFGKALTVVLKPIIRNKTPENTIALLQELIRRKGLHIAYVDLDEKNIGALLYFFIRHLGETRFTRTLIDAINMFVDVYESEIIQLSDVNLVLFSKLKDQVKQEVDVCLQIAELEGALSMILAGSQIESSKEVHDNKPLMPSFHATQDLVIGV